METHRPFLVSALSEHKPPWQRRWTGLPAPAVEGAHGRPFAPNQFPVFLFCKTQFSNLRADLESPLAKSLWAVRAKACRTLLVTVSLLSHSGLEQKTPKFPVAYLPGDHTTLSVLGQANMFQLLLCAAADKTKKCVLGLGRLWTVSGFMVYGPQHCCSNADEEKGLSQGWTHCTPFHNWCSSFQIQSFRLGAWRLS